MKPSYSIYSKRRMGLDNKVWLAMLATLLLSIILFGFKIANHVRCTPVVIAAKGTMTHRSANAFYVDERISFTAAMGHLQKVEWDFGDKSAAATGEKVIHAYTDEGVYLVTATVNGKCRESYRVVIGKMHESPSPAAIDQPQNPISGKTTVYAGTLEQFTSMQSADSYLWYVEEDASMGRKTGNAAGFSFANAGDYTLVLKLDNDSAKTFRKTIRVIQPGSVSAKTDISKYTIPDLPPPPPPPKKNDNTDPAGPAIPQDHGKPADNGQAAPPAKTKKFMQVPPEELQSMLNDVVAKKKSVADFDVIFCNGGESQVMANDKFTTLAELCQVLQTKKGLLKNIKAKVKLVKQLPNPDMDNKCLFSMKVEYSW